MPSRRNLAAILAAVSVLGLTACGVSAQRIDRVCAHHGGMYNAHIHGEGEDESVLVKCRDGYAVELEE